MAVHAVRIGGEDDHHRSSEAAPEDRDLINRAVAASGGDLTEFVVTSVTAAARRVFADRTESVLDADARRRWEAINAAPARDVDGLAALFARPSPFTEG